jgi:hypothetical protein
MPTDMDRNHYIERLCQRVNAHLALNPLPPHLERRASLFRSDQAAPQQPPNVDFSDLAGDPELQQSLAIMAQYTPSKWLLEQEAGLLVDRRDLHHRDPTTPRFRQSDPNEDIYDWARKQRLTGMCLSGGGIRSATFNLGILQGLAVRGWLDQFDYLSSVSGGGYIHSWLAAWLKRESTSRKERNLPQPELAAWQHVMSRLVPLPHHEPGTPIPGRLAEPDPLAAQVQQLPHTAQGSIHRRYLGRHRFVDTQCIDDAGNVDLDLSCRSLCAPSFCPERPPPAQPGHTRNEQLGCLLGHVGGS